MIMEKKEAIKILKDFHDKSALFSVRTALETLYPELKEPDDMEIRKALLNYMTKMWENSRDDVCGIHVGDVIAWLEKQGEQKPQRMISAEAKEAMYDKSADKVEPKCEESKTKIFDAPTPFEDKLYVFVAACEFLAIPSKIEFILEHSQEILDAAREQIGKEQKPTWSEEDEKMLADACIMLDWYQGNNWWKAQHIKNWLKSLKQRIGG